MYIIKLDNKYLKNINNDLTDDPKEAVWFFGKRSADDYVLFLNEKFPEFEKVNSIQLEENDNDN